MASALQLLTPAVYDHSCVTVSFMGGTTVTLPNIISISDIGESTEVQPVTALGSNRVRGYTPGMRATKDMTIEMDINSYKQFCNAYGGIEFLMNGNPFDLNITLFHPTLAPVPISFTATGCRLIDHSTSIAADGSPINATIVCKVLRWIEGVDGAISTLAAFVG
jgi:hypothetical protein